LAWTIEVSETARRSLAKLDRTVAKRITSFLRTRVAAAPDPRALGKPLRGPLREYWRYRVGDYRIICDIQDRILRILVIEIGDRKGVYG
jgi:mRNA interferase RelE/StbE